MKEEIKKDWKWYGANIYHKLALIGFILFSFYFLYSFFVSIIPLNIVDITPNPVTVLNPNKEVKSGERLHLGLNYCKYFDFPATVETTITNGVVWTLPDTVSNLTRGCGYKEFLIVIPKEIPLNEKVRLNRVLSYQVSFFTEVHESFQTEFFTVVP